jgi:hypothetical protein
LCSVRIINSRSYYRNSTHVPVLIAFALQTNSVAVSTLEQ